MRLVDLNPDICSQSKAALKTVCKVLKVLETDSYGGQSCLELCFVLSINVSVIQQHIKMTNQWETILVEWVSKSITFKYID